MKFNCKLTQFWAMCNEVGVPNFGYSHNIQVAKEATKGGVSMWLSK